MILQTIQGTKQPIVALSIDPTKIKQQDDEKSITTFNGRTTFKGKVIFYDSFDGTSISQSNWQHTVKIADAPVCTS